MLRPFSRSPSMDSRSENTRGPRFCAYQSASKTLRTSVRSGTRLANRSRWNHSTAAWTDEPKAMAATRQGRGILSTYWKRYLRGQARSALTWLTLRTRRGPISTNFGGGAGLEKHYHERRPCRAKGMPHLPDVQTIAELI